MKVRGIKKIHDCLYEIPADYRPGMRVPARIYASEKLIENMDDAVLQQLTNMALLPGIIKHAYCMADGHSGYGFPIGGVAAMDATDGVISPGGIGFDINCLGGQTRILNEHGYHVTISDMESRWDSENIACM